MTENFLLIVLLAMLGVCIAGLIAAAVFWRRADEDARLLVKRVSRLRLRRKLSLALALARDRRIPVFVRAIPPGLILYLSMPLDIVPDFIPVLGQLDDVLIVALGVGVLLRFTPRAVLEEQLLRLELPPGSS